MQTQILSRRKTDWRSIAIEVICYAYVILFIYAGFYKLLDFKFFRVSMERSPLIGDFAGLLAYLVPTGEIVVSLLLMGKRFRLLALYLATGIMMGFSAYIAYLLYFSPQIPCHCGGILAQMGWKAHLLMNIGFVLAGITGIILERQRRRTSA